MLIATTKNNKIYACKLRKNYRVMTKLVTALLINGNFVNSKALLRYLQFYNTNHILSSNTFNLTITYHNIIIEKN